MVSNALLIAIMSVYTLVIVVGLHSYEEKIKEIQKQSNYWHDLVHTLNNLSGEKTKDFLNLQEAMRILDQDNSLLKNRINALTQELIAINNSLPIQYESSTRSTNQWEGPSGSYANYVELELNQYEQKSFGPWE